MTNPNALSRLVVAPCSPVSGNIGQGHDFQGARRSRDASSKGHIVQGTHCSRDETPKTFHWGTHRSANSIIASNNVYIVLEITK